MLFFTYLLILFLIILILAAFLFLALLFAFPLKVAGLFNSEQQPDVFVNMSWLSPFLKATVTKHHNQLLLTVFLFNKMISVIDLTQKAKSSSSRNRSYKDYMNWARLLHFNKATLYASYGFADPSITGLVCGVIDFVTQYIILDELYNNADFFTVISYFNISAEAEINITSSLINVLRKKPGHRNIHLLSGNK